VRRYYTKDDLAALKEKYVGFRIEGDAIVATSVTSNPTYKTQTRQDNITKAMFRLRHKDVQVVCFKAVFVKVIEAGADPIEIMMRLHNYGVSVHKYVTLRTLDKFLDVLDVYLSPEVSVPDGVIMVMQGILR
jgi:hypothetical protein